MRLPTAIAAAVGLFIGLPGLILLAAVAGPVGWIVAAVVLPLAVLAVILWLGWFRPPRRRRPCTWPGHDVAVTDPGNMAARAGSRIPAAAARVASHR